MDILTLRGDGRNAAPPPLRSPSTSPGSPLDRPLIEAVQAHGMRTRGLPAHQVTVHYGDGSVVTIPFPADQATLTPSFWPRPEGWDFREGEAAFNGMPFKILGKQWAILRALAKRPGSPMPMDQLKWEAWGEEPHLVETGNLQGHVSVLRKKLRQVLELSRDTDPIQSVGGSYTLTLVATPSTEGRAAA